jgi:hypothetical protein
VRIHQRVSAGLPDTAPPVPVDRELVDGDVLDFGGAAEILAIPDHTDGGIAIHLPRHGVKFGVNVRRQPTVWTTLEYGCHVRDVHRIFNHRVRLMLTEDEPQFPNWQQDETAIADDYACQDPATVATELFYAARIVADTYTNVPAGAWTRRGLRSNGSEFTIATISIYHLHDIVHHAHDVRDG